MDVYKLWTCDDNSESQLSSTSSEIEKEIDVLRKTFDFVRLLKVFLFGKWTSLVKTVYP